jgi:hypothetical protein
MVKKIYINILIERLDNIYRLRSKYNPNQHVKDLTINPTDQHHWQNENTTVLHCFRLTSNKTKCVKD